MVKTKDLKRVIEIVHMEKLVPIITLKKEKGGAISCMVTEDHTGLRKTVTTVDVLGKNKELTLPVDWLLTCLKYCGDEVEIKVTKTGVINLISDKFLSKCGKVATMIDWKQDTIDKFLENVPKDYFGVDVKEIKSVFSAATKVGVKEFLFERSEKKPKSIFITLGDVNNDKVKPMRFEIIPDEIKMKSFGKYAFCASFQEAFNSITGKAKIHMDFEKQSEMILFLEGKAETVTTIIGPVAEGE